MSSEMAGRRPSSSINFFHVISAEAGSLILLAEVAVAACIPDILWSFTLVGNSVMLVIIQFGDTYLTIGSAFFPLVDKLCLANNTFISATFIDSTDLQAIFNL